MPSVGQGPNPLSPVKSGFDPMLNRPGYNSSPKVSLRGDGAHSTYKHNSLLT